ncbi:MAG: hypothetical protein QOI78_2229, partial [Actinomycetota bacterium]|nr:hypothetical protein [Actinomycetota bacterium]
MLLAPPDKTQAGFRYSARVRPEEPQLLPTEHMSVHVEHGLPRISVGVEHHAIPTLEHTLKLGNLTSSSNNITQKPRISGSKLPQVPIPLLGHHEHMNPSLRPNIPEGKGRLILKDNISRDLTSNDPLEERLVLTHATTLATRPQSAHTSKASKPSKASEASERGNHTSEGPKARARDAPFE